MPRTLLVLLLVVSLLLTGCQSPRHVPPANGVDAGLVQDREIDRKAVLDWCDRDPVARNTMYVLGVTLLGVAIVGGVIVYLLLLADDGIEVEWP